MIYRRPAYVLVHQGEPLLTVDASITPPFVIGEDVELHDDETRESMGWFLVEGISRTIPYSVITNVDRIAVAGQEVTVHLRRRLTQEEARQKRLDAASVAEKETSHGA